MENWEFDTGNKSDEPYFCLLYTQHSDAMLANETITDNMNLPQDSESVQWDSVFEVLSGPYAGMYGIKKPEEEEQHLMQGVATETEAEYSNEWFEEST